MKCHIFETSIVFQPISLSLDGFHPTGGETSLKKNSVELFRSRKQPKLLCRVLEKQERFSSGQVWHVNYKLQSNAMMLMQESES